MAVELDDGQRKLLDEFVEKYASENWVEQLYDDQIKQREHETFVLLCHLAKRCAELAGYAETDPEFVAVPLAENLVNEPDHGARLAWQV